MFTSSSERIIINLVDQVLDYARRYDIKNIDNGSQLYNRGMLLQLALTVSDPTLEHDKREETMQKRWYHVAFCGNVSVFVSRYDHEVSGEIKFRHFSQIPSNKWENTSNHDSCWKSDGLMWLSGAYFEMCENCNNNVAPIKLDTTCDIGFLSMWRDVQMTVSRNSDDNWRTLLNIRDI